MISLKGKAVVITGAGQGIGAACARALAKRGAAVVVNDISQKLADAVSAGIVAAGGKAVAVVADIASWDGAKSLIDGCVAAFGAIDGLVNNAGVIIPDRIDEAKEADLRAMVNVNVLGTAFCTSHAAKAMIPRKKGSIVNFCSGSHLGAATISGYAGSKGAVASFTYSWALELAAHGIRVNAVLPMAETKMRDINDAYRASKGMGAHPSPVVPPENNAPIVEFLLSDEGSGVNGQLVNIEGEMMALVTHPARLHPTVKSAQWTAETVAEVFRTNLAARQLPLGWHSLKADVIK
jgi:NAD(P)-dependent dehydrogenase (short-subunit alcohol dehydrogenase family)